MDIRARLFALADGRYRDFQSGLIPGLDPGRIIGVRTPALRALARELAGTEEAERLMDSLPHEYYEEDNLHALFINAAAGYDAAAARLERFLPYVDNWATCDLLKPKAFKKRPEGLEGLAARWMGSAHTYTARFGIGVYMNFYLGEGFVIAVVECQTVKYESVTFGLVQFYYLVEMGSDGFVAGGRIIYEKYFRKHGVRGIVVLEG